MTRFALQSVQKPAIYISMFCSIFYLLLLWGFIPYFGFGYLGISVWSAGFGESIAQDLTLQPHHQGIPYLSPPTFGLPLNIIQALFILLCGLKTADAYSLAVVVYLLIAYIGLLQLCKKLGVTIFCNILCSTIYLSLPFVWGHLFYGPLGVAFALFPTYFLLTWYSMTKLASYCRVRDKIKSLILLIFVFIFSLFMDGYTFVMYSFMSILLSIYFLIDLSTIKLYYFSKINLKEVIYLSIFLKRSLLCCAVLPLICVLLSVVLSSLLYKSYIVVNSNTYPVPPLSFFRGFGVDFITLLEPTKDTHFLYDWLRYSVLRNSKQFWGDFSTWQWNFLGISSLVSIFGAICWKDKLLLRNILLIIAIFALFFSMGPSLKFKTYKKPEMASQALMPEGHAHIDLPTGSIFTKVFGLQNMRATYRWMILFKFVLFIFLVVGLKVIYEWNSALSLALGCLFLLENTPDLLKKIELSNNNRIALELIEEDIIFPMQQKLIENERVLFLPMGNDFFVTYIAPILNIRVYNAGGDKNKALAKSFWPKVILHAYHQKNFDESVFWVLSSGLVDVIVLPYFDLLYHAHEWPPKPNLMNQLREKKLQMLENIKELYEIDYEEFFLTIRPRQNLAGKTKESTWYSLSKDADWWRFLGSGWSIPEHWGVWSDSKEVYLEFPSWIGHKAMYVFLDMNVFTHGKYIKQCIKVLQNKRLIDRLCFNNSNRTIKIVRLAPSSRPIRLKMVISEPKSPNEVGYSRDSRKLGVGIHRICISNNIRSCDQESM